MLEPQYPNLSRYGCCEVCRKSMAGTAAGRGR